MERNKDIDTDQDPVTAVARKEKELTRHDLERARDGNDLAETFGRQNIGPAIANKQILENKKKEDEKFESAVRQLLQQMREELERRLVELDRLIGETNAKIEVLRRELETTETLLEKQFGENWQEKLKRGELDPDDPLLRQWLMQQQQFKDYLERREKLVKERDDLERQITEIEGSNLPDHLKLERMKEVLESGASAGVQKVWQDEKMSEQVREVAAISHTDDYLRVESQESDSGPFQQFAGVSFATKAGFAEGIEAKTENIKLKFEKAAEPNTPDEAELIAAKVPVIKGPKIPG